jgi:hypothetical protein
VSKIERELMENERVLAPDEKYLARATSLVGSGSRSMSDEDFFVHYMLYRQEPTRSLKSYRWLTRDWYHAITIFDNQLHGGRGFVSGWNWQQYEGCNTMI